eukprot:357995-Chlamydomonas_euryale.AAC.2
MEAESATYVGSKWKMVHSSLALNRHLIVRFSGETASAAGLPSLLASCPSASQSQSYGEQTHKGYACVERSKTEGIGMCPSDVGLDVLHACVQQSWHPLLSITTALSVLSVRSSLRNDAMYFWTAAIKNVL